MPESPYVTMTYSAAAPSPYQRVLYSGLSNTPSDCASACSLVLVPTAAYRFVMTWTGRL